MPTTEYNFDAIVGPTHNYAGLSPGNLASTRHKHVVSNPRQAALQGLAKMKFLADLGVPQAVLPPQHRPDLAALRRLGFTGSDPQTLARAAKHAADLLAACSSASAMWAANAATVSPSGDTADRRLHLTPANLITNFHRSIEPPTTTAALRAIFADEKHFAVHDPLPATPAFADEGAANHTRLCASHESPGLELFTYGRSAQPSSTLPGARFPARQTLEASTAIARLHQLDPTRTVFLQQHPAAIDAGVFHNDVIAVGYQDIFFCHARAYVNQPVALKNLRRAFKKICRRELAVIEVSDKQVPLADAVSSYLFNSQLVTQSDGSVIMICPAECEQNPTTHRYLNQLLAKAATPIRKIHFVDLRQSMRNGGGPACVRLRVVLTDAQRRAAHPAVFLTDALYKKLTAWVKKHYRDSLRPADLADPKLLKESRTALDALTKLLRLPPLYPFQK